MWSIKEEVIDLTSGSGKELRTDRVVGKVHRGMTHELNFEG